MSLELEAANSRREPARLTVLYVVALSAVALLSFAGQLVIQNFLHRQRSDSTVLNIAGRQRMLSQKLTKAALAFAGVGTPIEKRERLEELRDALRLWERSHHGLQHGDEALGLPGENSVVVRQQFADLENDYSALRHAGEQLLSGENQAEAVQTFLSHEASFLTGMDAIVSQYEREAQDHVARLQFIERALFALTIAVLLLEGMLVFRPAVRHIQSTLDALRKTGEQLQQAKEAAEAANQAKSRLLANTSHELRTPLHAILGMTEQLASEDISQQQLRQISVVRSSATTLHQLVNDLLDLAAIEAGKLELRAAPVSLADLMADAADILQASMGEKPLQLLVDVDAKIPRYVLTDGLRLKQVLLNLGGNAIKFTEQGTITLRATLLRSDGAIAVVRLSVTDTGIGIPDEHQAQVFEAFTQLEGRSCSASGGIGLGLAISRHLVHLLGGDLQLKSKIGCGTEFVFELSLAVAESDIPSDLPPTVDVSSLVGRRILVVDDAPVNRELAARALASAGCEVAVADRGQAALAKLRDEPMDAVLLDLRLPDFSGREVAEQMRSLAGRQSRPPWPIIALTADGNSIGRLDPELFRALLLKPASGDQILAAVASLFSGTPTSEPLARLRGDRILLSELRSLFATEAPRLLARLEQGWHEQNAKQVHHAAHQLRGQALQIGADDIAALAGRLETKDSNRTPQELNVLRSRVEAWLCEEAAP